MKLNFSPGLRIFLKSLAGIRFLVIPAVILIGSVSGPIATKQEDNYRTIVAELITGDRSSWDEDQVLRFGQNFVFRISLYQGSSEGELLPHRVRSLANLEIHLQDDYPDVTKVLYPVDKLVINGHEFFIVFPRYDDFYEGLGRIVLVVTDQNNLASVFRQVINFSADNLLAQPLPVILAGKTREEGEITLCAQPEGSSLTVERLVQCHRNSIGSDQALADCEYRLAEGTGRATGRTFKVGGHLSGMVEGQSMLFSDHRSTTLRLKFESDYYPVDGFSFDGEDVLKPAFESGQLGYLAELLENCQEYVSAGLVGGVLSTIWPLLDLESSKVVLEFRGLEKTDGSEYLTLRCRFSRDRTAKLYFDPESMQHLMTKYSGKTVGDSNLGPGKNISLVERFSEFRVFDGLYLPTRWELILGLPQETIQMQISLTQVFHRNVVMLKP